MSNSLDDAAALISRAGALLVCAGAGLGVDSGLPDFRGSEGFWRAYPPYARLGLRFEELADPRHFGSDPSLAWGFYGHRLSLYRRTVPHRGFGILLSWGSSLPHGVRVFTSNVDGQFQRAGFLDVAEAHGSIHHLQCFDGCGAPIWDFAGEVVVDEVTMRAVSPLPRCPSCGGLARPNILMFGDFSWQPERSQAQLDSLASWRRAADGLVVVEIGAGTAVPTVRRFGELASAATGDLVRINPRGPEIRHGRGVSLAGGALETLSALDALVTF